MERTIGEIFEYNGEWYQCVQGDCCEDCAFDGIGFLDGDFECNESQRDDKKSVIFKRLEKVGEPYMSDGHLMQTLTGYKQPINFTDKSRLCYFAGCYLRVEIKQDQEDMEEKKLNLKPFNFQKAKAGQPVCTRDGRKARIICFDRRGDKFPIVALLDGCNEEHSEVAETFTNEGLYEIGKKSSNDLMMLPEKKEGWVNVYKDSVYDTKDEALIGRSESRGYIDTIKISWEE